MSSVELGFAQLFDSNPAYQFNIKLVDNPPLIADRQRPPDWEDLQVLVPARGRSRFSHMSPEGSAVLRRHAHLKGESDSWIGLEGVAGDIGRDERTMRGYFYRRFNKLNGIEHRGQMDSAAAVTEGLEEDPQEPLLSRDIIKNNPFTPLLGLLLELRDRKAEDTISGPLPSENGNTPKTEHSYDALPAVSSDQLEGLAVLKTRLESREMVKRALVGRGSERPLVRKVRSERIGTTPLEDSEEVVSSEADPMSSFAQDRAKFAQRTRVEKMISGKVKDRGTGRRLYRIETLVRQDRMRTTQGRAFEQKQAEVERRIAEAKEAPQQENLA